MYRDDRPLTEVASAWGVTKQRAGQIHLQALAALRKALGKQATGRGEKGGGQAQDAFRRRLPKTVSK